MADLAVADVADAAVQSPAVRAFFDAFCAELEARNYAVPYVARRCRVTDDVAAGWFSGEEVPSGDRWYWLCRMHRDFQSSRFAQLWADADASVSQDADARYRASLDSGRAPISSPCGNAGDGTPSPACDIAPSLPEADLQDSSTPVSAASRTLAVETRTIRFTCKLTRGRLVYLDLPADLSLADVDRISAFMRTQADDA